MLQKHCFSTRRASSSNLRGMSLIELVVVMAILGILASLLIPAVQKARESARRSSCVNNLRQIGVAIHLHHESHRHFPTNGWGFQWVGDPARGFGEHQPGGWVFNILPFVESGAIRDLPRKGSAGASEMLQTPISLFNCPSRRHSRAYPYRAQHWPPVNAAMPTLAAKSDYAICAGDHVIDSLPGPSSYRETDVRGYEWPPFRASSGVSFIRSRIRIADIRDGTTGQIAVGEKRLNIRWPADYGDDQTMYLGDDADIRRWTSETPKRDTDQKKDIQHFGSAHPGGALFVMCDGSTKSIGFEVEEKLFQSMGNRHDSQ